MPSVTVRATPAPGGTRRRSYGKITLAASDKGAVSPQQIPQRALFTGRQRCGIFAGVIGGKAPQRGDHRQAVEERRRQARAEPGVAHGGREFRQGRRRRRPSGSHVVCPDASGGARCTTGAPPSGKCVADPMTYRGAITDTAPKTAIS